MTACPNRKPVVQCKSCPWRVDCVPDRDIPNYNRTLAEKLKEAIGRPGDVTEVFTRERRIMACHYSKPGEEFPCAGWLANQLGPGNNIAVRLDVATGRMPPPEIDGPQHEHYEDTLCTPKPKKRRSRR